MAYSLMAMWHRASPRARNWKQDTVQAFKMTGSDANANEAIPPQKCHLRGNGAGVTRLTRRSIRIATCESGLTCETAERMVFDSSVIISCNVKCHVPVIKTSRADLSNNRAQDPFTRCDGRGIRRVGHAIIFGRNGNCGTVDGGSVVRVSPLRVPTGKSSCHSQVVSSEFKWIQVFYRMPSSKITTLLA